MDTIKTYCELTGTTAAVAAVAGPYWSAIALIPVRRNESQNAGAFCYSRNRITGKRSRERVTLHRNLRPDDLRTTLLHEIAHIIHTYTAGRTDHGPAIERFARALGCDAAGCGTALQGSQYLSDTARFQYRCKDCGAVVRKYRRPHWDRPVGETVNRCHTACRHTGPNHGRLVRMSDEEIQVTLNKETH
jgi:predicted SprT family Zn-dependent metalloprotease